MTEDTITTFIPGDPLVLSLRFRCGANIRSVWAMFSNAEQHNTIVLTGDSHHESEHLSAGEPKDQQVVMRYNAHESGTGMRRYGKYELSTLTATTSAGKTVQFDPVPQVAFRFEPEPDEAPTPLTWKIGPPQQRG